MTCRFREKQNVFPTRVPGLIGIGHGNRDKRGAKRGGTLDSLSDALTIVAVADSAGTGGAAAAGERRDTRVALEEAGEVLRGAEAEPQGNVGDRHIGFAQKTTGGPHAAGEQKLTGRKAGQGSETRDEVRRGHARPPRQILDGEIAFRVRVHLAHKRFETLLALGHGVGVGGVQNFQQKVEQSGSQSE